MEDPSGYSDRTLRDLLRVESWNAQLRGHDTREIYISGQIPQSRGNAGIDSMARSREKQERGSGAVSRDERFGRYSVELYVDDDGDWLAHFADLPEISAFAATPEQALDKLETGWRVVKDSYRAEGKTVPVPPARRPSGRRSGP